MIDSLDEKVFSKNDVAKVLLDLAYDCFYDWQRTKDDRYIDKYLCYISVRDMFLNM